MSTAILPFVDPIPLTPDWGNPGWAAAPVLRIDHFHPAGSPHRPGVQARAAYDRRYLAVQFRVEDRYIRACHTELQAMICEDSCVECFVQPAGSAGYFNFECSCIGTLHVHYVEDPTRTPQGLARSTPLTPDEVRQVIRLPSLPVEPLSAEIEEPLCWTLLLAVPFQVFERYGGVARPERGDTWRVNLYKCADLSSHPHWAAWAPIGEELNFHQPDRFGTWIFG